MSAAAAVQVRSTEEIFSQNFTQVERKRVVTQRKPMRSEGDILRRDLKRPSVFALQQHRVLILMQWKAGRPIAKIADSFKVPRRAVEEILREQVVA